MTNKEWLATLTDEQFYDEWKKAYNEIGMDNINTRTAMINWLGSEQKDTESYRQVTGKLTD